MRRVTPVLSAALLTSTLAAALVGAGVLMMALAGVTVLSAWPLLFRRQVAAEVAWSPPTPVRSSLDAAKPPERSRQPGGRATVAALGRAEARELAGSIWFGVGIGFWLLINLAFAVVWGEEETHLWPEEAMLAPWFMHPLVGMTILAVHRNVTRTRRDGTDELFDTCPATPTTRTWGFLAGAWVPAAAGTVSYLSYLSILMLRGVDFDGPFGLGQTLDIVAASVLCVGGVAVGVALGRWIHFGLAPVVAVVAIGGLSLGIATEGDPHWNPIAELSTLPPIGEVEQLVVGRHTGGHVLWLLALTGIVVVTALARHRRDRSVAVAASVLVLLAAVAGVVATRPVSGDAADAIASKIIDPATHQSCLAGAGGRLEVCTFEHYGDIGRAALGPVSAIVEALPPESGEVTLRQRYLDGSTLADLPPAIRRHFSDGLPRRPSGENRLDFGLDAHAVDRARFDVAFTAAGLSTAPAPGDEPRVIAGEARGVVALWLATRGMDPADAAATATAFDSQNSDPFTRGLAWYEECTTPLVVWSAQDLEAARALMALPDGAVTRALAMDWTRWTDPDTGTDELLDAVGLPNVGPFDHFASRAEHLGC